MEAVYKKNLYLSGTGIVKKEKRGQRTILETRWSGVWGANSYRVPDPVQWGQTSFAKMEFTLDQNILGSVTNMSTCRARQYTRDIK